LRRWGEGDTGFQATADAKARAALMPHGRFEVMAGEHSPWLDDPAACVGLMAALYTR
jgi:pimeloyl-ACP methyl ester carboxylesterase